MEPIMLRILFIFYAVLMLVIPAAGADEEITTSFDDQQAVAVTIYNQNLALVRDQRIVTVPTGTQVLAFRDVSGKIRPETALLSGDLKVLEQNFEYDLLTPKSLLRKYVGRDVSVVKTHPTTGEEHLVQAHVLSVNSGVVLRMGDHIETGIPGRLVFPNVPGNLRDRPTLTMLVESKKHADQQVELCYLTGGLSWQADYVAELDADDTRMDLSGWVTLANESGTSYRNARLQLVAGDVHRVRKTLRRQLVMEDMVMAAGAPREEMARESMFEYHLYTLGRPTSINDNQRKQVALMHAGEVSCTKEFVLEGRPYYFSTRAGEIGRKMKVGVFVELKNEKEAGLGNPLPAGTIRVYKKDSHGSLQFIGEDHIDHTPENEVVRLKLGDAFDVTADKKQTDFKKLSGFTRYNYAYESAYELNLKNAKDTQVTVKVLEPVPGDWKIIAESAKYTKEAANIVSWIVDVPAKSSITLTYRVQVKY
ncbi:MAG: DUF4139 domain-containing protein [Desulfobulbaceae bacterium]|nr:DUF4139 domain-containing protein [Desulfobulbaceae bacterium]